MTVAEATGQDFRRVLSNFATGVVVVTGVTAKQAPAGLTCQSFTSVSMEPPLISVSPARSSATWAAIEPSGRFAVNVLAENQHALSHAFARTGTDKFAGVGWSYSELSLPILDGAIAHIECETTSVVPAGDHVIVIGRVLRLHAAPEEAGVARPLVFFRSAYHRITPHTR
jgi:3-hydroxy-9,10-secoandrosta-1,3,5(10)-triene-9,17-dione monooxygenase reductase component